MMVMTFWVLPIVVFLIFATRYRKAHSKSLDSTETAIEIHKDRLAELEGQYQQGSLSEEEYQSFKLEEEKALLADVGISNKQSSQGNKLPWLWVPLFSFSVFVAAAVTYQSVGASDAVNVRSEFQQLQVTGSDSDSEQVSQALSSYQTLLQKHPSDVEGWFRLSRMQMDMQQFESAITSFQHVLTEVRKIEHQAQDEATILSYIGQAQMSLNRLPEAMSSFEESLTYYQLDSALGLAGRIAFEQADYKKAIDYWTRLKLRNQSSDATVIDEFIDKAKAQLASQGIDYEAEQPLNIIVHVELPSAWEGLAENAALFVYAREPGQRMPLAVKRLAITGQTMAVMLSDSDAMGPMGGLSGHEAVEVTARVSLSGIANTQPGDWAGEAKIVTLDQKANKATIVIEQP